MESLDLDDGRNPEMLSLLSKIAAYVQLDHLNDKYPPIRGVLIELTLPSNGS